jgi:hypothetical protein
MANDLARTSHPIAMPPRRRSNANQMWVMMRAQPWVKTHVVDEAL